MSRKLPLKPTVLCEICGQDAGRGKRNRPKKFCSSECDGEWRRKRMTGNKLHIGRRQGHKFPIGHEPWNKGVKGIHLSPETEFKPGQVAINHEPVGTVKIRFENKNRKYRAWVKVAEPNKWKLRAVVVWESANGVLPKGSVVHHKDRDTLNDDLSNLAGLTRQEHMNEHRDEYLEIKRKKKKINLFAEA